MIIQRYKGVIFPACNVAFLAQVQIQSGPNLVYIQQSNLTSISYSVWDRNINQTPSTPLVVANVIYNTLQNGTVWTQDNIGYNFEAILPGSNFPKGSRVYGVEFVFTLTNGIVFGLAWDLQTLMLQELQTNY
jgi:hypothetical protein